MKCEINRYRQGNVFLFPATIPAKATKKADGVVALGEATGHAHKVFDGDVFVDDKGDLWLRAAEGTELRHVKGASIAEHETIAVDPGEYRVVIQREYEPEGWRQVND